jgi:precorrin-6A synthase
VTVRVLVVGIGSGDPAHLTGEAVAALNAVDVFLVADKRAATRDLVTLRAELCAAVITHDRYRFVEVPDPERGPDADRDSGAYAAAVRDWHTERARRHADAVIREVGDSGVVGMLVWGDPSLYDSTLRVVETVRDLLAAGLRTAGDGSPPGEVGGRPPSGRSGVAVEVTVVPGISSVSLLAARHKIALNRVGQPVHITTGRRLLAEYVPALGDVVVMLDGDLACAGLVEQHPDLEIFWGAQLGLADEALVRGRLADVLPEIRARRDAVRAARGWVMDTYLLRPGP